MWTGLHGSPVVGIYPYALVFYFAVIRDDPIDIACGSLVLDGLDNRKMLFLFGPFQNKLTIDNSATSEGRRDHMIAKGKWLAIECRMETTNVAPYSLYDVDIRNSAELLAWINLHPETAVCRIWRDIVPLQCNQLTDQFIGGLVGAVACFVRFQDQGWRPVFTGERIFRRHMIPVLLILQDKIISAPIAERQVCHTLEVSLCLKHYHR